MPKTKTAYVCSVCGSMTAKWYGQCPDCGSWNTIEEATPELNPNTAIDVSKPQKQRGGTGAEALPFSGIASGLQLYQHNFILTSDGDWTIVQQGMNVQTKTARRYHWCSQNLRSFIENPHTGITGENIDIAADI